MKRLVFAPLARDDLEAIGLYIAEDNPERALTFVAELEAIARQTAERPQSFRQRDDLAPGLRAALHGRYMIFFRELADEVRVERIVHGARNLRALFEE